MKYGSNAAGPPRAHRQVTDLSYSPYLRLPCAPPDFKPVAQCRQKASAGRSQAGAIRLIERSVDFGKIPGNADFALHRGVERMMTPRSGFTDARHDWRAIAHKDVGATQTRSARVRPAYRQSPDVVTVQPAIRRREAKPGLRRYCQRPWRFPAMLCAARQMSRHPRSRSSAAGTFARSRQCTAMTVVSSASVCQKLPGNGFRRRTGDRFQLNARPRHQPVVGTSSLRFPGRAQAPRARPVAHNV